MDTLVHNLDPSHSAALRAVKLGIIDRNLAVQTLMLGADESVFALRDLADHYWSTQIIKHVPTEDSFEARKSARKRHLAEIGRLEELREAMVHIWGRTRVSHALANSDLAPTEGTIANPRMDKKACGRARRGLAREGNLIRRPAPSKSQAEALEAFKE